MNTLKLGALIEALSTLSFDVLCDLGLDHLEYDLQECFDDALDEWLRVAGYPHPLDIEECDA